MNTINIQKLIFAEVQSYKDKDPERYTELESFLAETWFGSPESIDEFVESNDFQELTPEQIAREYVEIA